ncbi:hypothetical protein MKW98_026618 [Papaver atlanticum]|uniref:Protein-tyrosine sulfotransferase n=1 Tax=Papaver atlanticum TaxID=357466 RepID=A0AAD4S072_9MAGN|nr:hypothetical protein MKW98_026618 [Papaver atlanticum]
MAKELAALVLVILTLVCASSVHAVPDEEFYTECENIVKKWAASSLDAEVKDKHTLQDLLFFLHIPRTGGRTYYYCFLRKLYTSYLECPRSYDKLHFDPSKPDCRLLVTHDDYSIMSKLPKGRTSVVTILRNPIDRVFSTYEFAVEVAARFLVHPNLTSATQMSSKVRSGNIGVSTLDIWPWKYLVPWMRADLFARRNGREHGDFREIKETKNPYEMKDIVMPFEEFINSAEAYDIIHNGATFQIAGLTNNSYLEDREVRSCAMGYQSLGKYVLEVAKKRLDNMLYVGLTEHHKESATIFADVVGKQVFSQLQALSSNFTRTTSNKTETTSSSMDSKIAKGFRTKERKASEIPSSKNAQSTNETMTVEELMEAYDGCSSSLRKTQARRRTSSFKRISPANFSKEARLQVPEAILQKIKSLNSLDMELYKHAQHIFEQQKNRLLQETVQVEVPGDDMFNKDPHKHAEQIVAQQKSPPVRKSVKVDMQKDDGFKEDQYGVLVFIVKNILFGITVFFSVVLVILLVSSKLRRLRTKLHKWFNVRRH